MREWETEGRYWVVRHREWPDGRYSYEAIRPAMQFRVVVRDARDAVFNGDKGEQ